MREDIIARGIAPSHVTVIPNGLRPPDAAGLHSDPVPGALLDGPVIARAVHRLLLTETGVRIVDFKTGAHVPATADAVQAGYVRQMAAYVAALRVIFPGRHVEAALLFTAGPRLIAVPDALMDRQKPS